MRTVSRDAVVLWMGDDQTKDDYLGLGLDNGLVKVKGVVACR